MKKLLYICLSVWLLSACSSDSEPSKNKEEKESKEVEKEVNKVVDKTAVESDNIIVPTGMDGELIPCDCYRKTIELMNSGENVEAELAAVNEICQELVDKIGKEEFKSEMELCARADTLNVDISGLTACDCKTEITAMMDRALEMETNESLAADFRLIQDKCAVLEAKMSSTKYKEALELCD